MKPTVRVALIFVALYAIIKVVILQAGLNLDERWSIMIMFVNMLLLLLATFFGLHAAKKAEGYPKGVFVGDFKNSMQAALTYSICISVFVLIFYNFIDTETFTFKIQQHVEQAQQFEMSDLPEGSNPQNKTREEIIAEMRTNAEGMFSPNRHFLLTLLATFVLSLFYSLLVTLIYRKILQRS